MKVVIRVDASIWIGTGHVMRCLVLADELKKQGWQVDFACLAQTGDLIDFLEKKDHEVKRLSLDAEYKTPKFDGDYQAWLQRTELEDASDFLKIIKRANWVIVDHYGIGAKWEKQVRQALNCQLLAIDDLNRKHHSNLILDQNLYQNMQERYSTSQAQKLIGPEYALLRPRFAKLRNFPPQKHNQVFAFFGGSDPTNECLKLLQAASKIENLPFKLKVITGRVNDRSIDLKKYAKLEIEVVQVCDDFELELAQSRYAIGASGTTNWERFCLNIPATIVSVAANQRELSLYLAKNNHVFYLGNGQKTNAMTYYKELIRLKKSWSSLASFAPLDLDCLGVQRVVRAMKTLK